MPVRCTPSCWLIKKLPEAVARLRQTNFFIAPEILNQVWERDRLRREQAPPNKKDPVIKP
jgi:hypothetical protein